MAVIDEAVEAIQRDLRKLTAKARRCWGDKAEAWITIGRNGVHAYAHDKLFNNCISGYGETVAECIADARRQIEKIPIPPTDADIAATLGIPYPLAAE